MEEIFLGLGCLMGLGGLLVILILPLFLIPYVLPIMIFIRMKKHHKNDTAHKKEYVKMQKEFNQQCINILSEIKEKLQ